jgi:hypothetical protein
MKTGGFQSLPWRPDSRLPAAGPEALARDRRDLAAVVVLAGTG